METTIEKNAESLKTTINNFCHFNIVDTIVIIILSIIIYRLVYNLFVKGFKTKINKKISKKNQTYIKLITSVIKYAFIGLTVLIILQINGINVSSLLAGVGIVGVVIGLAIQDALKDIIRGFNILSDDYFSVGDIILYKNITGKVISLGLNSTKIQDIYTGNIVTIANREILEVSIISKNIYINIPLSYELKLDMAEKVINEIVKEISKNENTNNVRYLGINNFKESNIDYLIGLDTNPDNKLQVRRNALNTIMKVLEKNNIEIPYNQLDIHNK